MAFNLVYKGIRVRVHDGPYLVDGRPTPEAVEYYTSLIEGLGKIRRFAAGKLLTRYNDVWLDDEIGTLDESGFVKRLAKPVIVLCDERGSAEVLFDDGGIFAGHAVEVSIEDGEPVSASIAG